MPPRDLRGDLVRLETYFAEDGRLATRRDWHITDAATGAYLGAATRWAAPPPQRAHILARTPLLTARRCKRPQECCSRLALWLARRRCAPAGDTPADPGAPRLPPSSPPRSPSTWVTINTQTRKLAKLPEEVRARWLTLSPSPPRAVLPPSDTKRKLQEFPEAPALQGPLVTARRSDVDPNGHINNVCYLSWALEVVPDRVYGGYDLVEVRPGRWRTGWRGGKAEGRPPQGVGRAPQVGAGGAARRDCWRRPMACLSAAPRPPQLPATPPPRPLRSRLILRRSATRVTPLRCRATP
jgi:hypothetical protein